MQQSNSSDCYIILSPLSYGEGLPSIIKHGSIEIKEFPITTKKQYGRHILFSGGLFSFISVLSNKGMDTGNNEYVLSYIYPRDIAGQPMIKDLSFARKFTSLVSLHGAGQKLHHMLTDFKFTDISTAANNIDWTHL